MTQTRKLSEIPVGEIFKIGNYKFIKFTDESGVAAAVSKDILFDSKYGKNNNFAKSNILVQMESGILPEIERIIGEENVVAFETNLLSLDGSAKYGVMKSKISLPTFDFYRRHRAIFEKYKLGCWWWLATPDSTSEYNSGDWCVGVSPSGIIRFDYCDVSLGVRPFWNFSSSIFVSYKE